MIMLQLLKNRLIFPSRTLAIADVVDVSVTYTLVCTAQLVISSVLAAFGCPGCTRVHILRLAVHLHVRKCLCLSVNVA